jgi:Ca2+-binding RTX toxin-like protein
VSYTVVDTIKPTLSINAPAHGATYTLGQHVAADYDCADETALASCAGSTPEGAAIDTSSVGTKTFTIAAVDGSGNTASVTATYVVANPPAACGIRKTGTNVANVLIGTIEGDAIFGLAGDDRISGRAGDDCLRGGAGNDRLLGQKDKDRLWGGAGNDVLRGGRGDDNLRGGGGDDRLKGGAGDNSYSGRRGNDEIRARNGRAEVVRCGRGDDVAIVDEEDRTRGCETIRS